MPTSACIASTAARRLASFVPDAVPHPLFVLNRPNLNLLGRREPELYGTTTLAEIRAGVEQLAAELGLACEFRQTNHDGVT